MFIARVVGNVWATKKIEVLEKRRLLLVQPMEPKSGKSKGKVMMAVCDKIDAGIGDVVLIMDEGSSAKQVLGTDPRPVRTFVFAIIDQIQTGSDTVRYT